METVAEDVTRLGTMNGDAKSDRRVPHVALLIETSREYARGLLRGVARYHQEHGPWSIYFEPHGLHAEPPSWLKDWRGDGILARVDNQAMADAVLATGIPAIDLRGALSDVQLPFIGVDNRPVAQLAFDHLRTCGITNFGFCGTPRGENPNQDFRCDYFAKLVADAGFECQTCFGADEPDPSWEIDQSAIADWLKELPKPVGVMTCHDDRGQQVLDACRRAGLDSPDEVAVISVDNDQSLCNLCTPPLTSIDVNPGRVGYEAAAMLARAMEGEELPTEPFLMGPPRGIAVRQSTETNCIDDEDVAAALKIIREEASKGLRVNSVVARCKNSPSTLERRFKKIVGRTLKAEIDRLRLSKAKLWLAESTMPISKVSELSGFNEPKYFCEVFRKNEGMTATAYRQKFRTDGD